MIPISPRLLCCASMIQGDFVCDIGTDHAYLPAYLITGGRCSQVIATDVKQGPLESAKGTLRRYHAEKQVQLILSDGFQKVRNKGITDVIIAGMGGETIRGILSDKSADFIKTRAVNLILQPMTKAEVLRQWLSSNGFAVKKETAVKDTHIYTVMQAVYTGQAAPFCDAQCYYGMLKRSDPLTKIYISGVQDRLHTKAHGLDEAGAEADAAAVRKLISEINRWLNPEKGESNDRTEHL
ncbi:MAG: SAM-dependent methyltransferase [Oscillospiraceae bacterium]|nr:SAM-dependent methyltransferase [Oscillospiraceae bacterium]